VAGRKKGGKKKGKQRREGAFILVKHFCEDLVYSFLAGSCLSVASIRIIFVRASLVITAVIVYNKGVLFVEFIVLK
jgi:hypothetical protein